MSRVLCYAPLNALFLAGALVCAGSASAQSESADAAAQTPDPRATLIATFEANNCVLDESQAEDAFEAAGLDPRMLNDLAETMFDAGEMAETEDGRKVRLLTGDVCEAQIAEPRAVLIATFEANNCLLEEDQAEDAFEAAGIDPEMLEELAEAMFSAGELIESPEDRRKARLLIGDVCGPNAAEAAAPADAAAPQSPRESLIAAFEGNNCVLTEGMAEELVEAGAATEAEYESAARAMLDAGEVVFDNQAQIARLVVGSVCGNDADAAAETDAPAQIDGLSADANKLLTALQENGCRLSERGAKNATGFEEEVLVAALLELLQSSHATMDDDDLVASGVGACPVFERAVAPQETIVRHAVIQVLEDAECALRGPDLSRATREVIGRDMFREHGENVFVAMLADGELAFDIASEQVTLTIGAVCGPEDDADADVDADAANAAENADVADANADAESAAAAPDLADAFRRRALIKIIERAGGSIAADALPAATRYTYAASAPLADTLEAMIADGLLREENGVYTLTNGEVRP